MRFVLLALALIASAGPAFASDKKEDAAGARKISSAETYPTIAEAMTAAALKLLEMTDRLEALDRSEQLVGASMDDG